MAHEDERDPRVDRAARPAAISWSVPDSPAGIDAIDPAFEPLRVAPPPTLRETRWLRRGATSTVLVVAVVVPLVARTAAVVTDVRVVSLHVVAGSLLLWWSARAMTNADRLLPPSRYRAAPRPAVAVGLWLAAFVAPGVVAVVLAGVDVSESSSAAAPVLLVSVLVVAAVVAYAPFRYLAGWSRRIGVPARDLTAWFWAPLVTVVAGVALLGVGLGRDLAADGWSPTDRGVAALLVYGLPAFVFGLSTWRALTVFDELIDLRWNRWRIEWEHTMRDLAHQPLPPRSTT